MISKMKKNNKGFTLMEMLIVVAIIAILIAIAIPTFSSSLNKARVATDEANIRSGYANVMATVLTSDAFDVENNGTGTATFALNKDGSVTADTATDPYTTVGSTDADVEIAGVKIEGGWGKGEGVTYTYDYTKNEISIKVGD